MLITLRRGLTVFCVTLSLKAAQIPQRPNSEGRNEYSEYKTITAELFAPPSEGRPRRIMAVLQFLPSFQREEEIVLSIGLDSKNRVTVFSVEESIWKKLTEAREKGRHPTAQEIRAAAGLQRKQVDVEPQEMKQWLIALVDSVGEYSKSVRVTNLGDSVPEPFIITDGVHYNLVLETLQGRVTVDLADSGTLDDDAKDTSLVKAMKSIRRRVAELQQKR